MTRNRCPEAVYGEHGAPNTSGRCPYCGERLCARGSKSRQFTPNYAQVIEHALKQRPPSGAVDEMGEAIA